MIRKLTLSLLLAVSVLGVMPVGASAEWKQDQYKNYSWEENGVKVTGWKQMDGSWYNFGNNGYMTTGWLQDNGNWYYFWSNGTMASKCWLWNGGFWYYFDEDGKLEDNSAIVQNRQYNITPATIISQDLSAQATSQASVQVKTID